MVSVCFPAANGHVQLVYTSNTAWLMDRHIKDKVLLTASLNQSAWFKSDTIVHNGGPWKLTIVTATREIIVQYSSATGDFAAIYELCPPDCQQSKTETILVRLTQHTNKLQGVILFALVLLATCIVGMWFEISVVNRYALQALDRPLSCPTTFVQGTCDGPTLPKGEPGIQFSTRTHLNSGETLKQGEFLQNGPARMELSGCNLNIMVGGEVNRVFTISNRSNCTVAMQFDGVLMMYEHETDHKLEVARDLRTGFIFGPDAVFEQITLGQRKVKVTPTEELSDRLLPGQALAHDSCIQSKSGGTFLCNEGCAVFVRNFIRISYYFELDSVSRAKEKCVLAMQYDGNLVLYDYAASNLAVSIKQSSKTGYFVGDGGLEAVPTPDVVAVPKCEMVMKYGHPAWDCYDLEGDKKGFVPNPLRDRLNPGDSLAEGEFIQAGDYQLQNHHCSLLILFKGAVSRYLHHNDANPKASCVLKMQPDGDLVFGGRVIRTKAHKGYLLTESGDFLTCDNSPDPSAHGATAIYPGQVLNDGEYLENGDYTFKNEDCSVYLYKKGIPYYPYIVSDKGKCQVQMTRSGRLVSMDLETKRIVALESHSLNGYELTEDEGLKRIESHK